MQNRILYKKVGTQVINISNVSLSYGSKELFSKLSYSIKPNSKIGLVGKNGTGKSSLFKLLTGNLLPTSGSIDIPKETKLGYLSQFLTINPDQEVRDAARTAFEEVLQLDERLDALNLELGTREDYESESYQKLIDDISLLSQQLEMFDANKIDAQVEKVLKGLGFSEAMMEKQISQLSGGWQMRVELAKLLLEEPDYLFLDEPINHLDIESIIWLERWLKNYSGAFVIIAHDQEFLDNCVSEIVEIDNYAIHVYKTNYSDYLIEKEVRYEQLESSFKNQQKQIAQKEQLVQRFKAKASKAAMARSIQKELDRMDRVEFAEQKDRKLRIQFREAKRANEVVCKATAVSKAFGDQLILDKLDFQLERGEKIAFVGQNGQGKSTFAKILIGELDSSAGQVELGSNIQVAYFRQDAADSLPGDQTLLEYMESHADESMRTRVRALLGAFLFSGPEVEKKISVLSGGEKNRLAFARLLLEPFNLLVLDEPTHHLDISAKENLKLALQQYEGAMLIISHDRFFLEGLTDQIVEFRDKKIKRYLGGIQYFLQEREAESMRQIEKKTTKPETSPSGSVESPTNMVRDPEDQKRIKALEKKIEQMEETIRSHEGLMAQPGFYEGADAQHRIEEYKSSKAKLAAYMAEWEELI